MKTKLLITFCFLASTIMVMRAQDIITKTNGDEIRAKVTEVDVNEVKYKRFDNVSGPTYTIAKSDIFKIKYENGEQDMFGKSADKSSVSDQKNTPDQIQPRVSSNQYPSTARRTSSTVSSPITTGMPQENIRKTEVGVKGGFNFAYESASNSYQSDVRTGIYLGFFLEAPIGTKVGFQPELVYSMQGGVLKDGTEKLDYINLPLIFKFYVSQHRLSIDAGPQVGYMISAKDNSYDFYDSSHLKKIEVSICVGLSYKITEKLDATFRVNVGMTKIYDNYTNTNNVGQLGVGYRF